MRPFTFCHAADLHIDSPFCGVVSESPEVAEALYASTFQAYKQLIDSCIERQVDFVVIAGDVYDGQDRSVRAQLRFRDGLAKLSEAGIASYVIHGNHDPLDGCISSIEWPENVHVFGKEWETIPVEVDGEILAYVSGVSFPTKKVARNLAKEFSSEKLEAFHIGLLHCNVGSDTGHELYAPCELKDLLAHEVDYWALGHVHTRAILHEDPYVVYPGNPQGRSIREQDARGCYFVDVNRSLESQMEFEEFGRVRWQVGQVSIDELTTLDQLEGAIANEIERLLQLCAGRNLVCRIQVVGRGDLYQELCSPDVENQLEERLCEQFVQQEPFAWLQRLKIDCSPNVDLQERATHGDLLAEALTVAREISSSEEQLQEFFVAALRECWGHRAVKSALDQPTTKELQQFIQDAELLCLDLLEGDSED